MLWLILSLLTALSVSSHDVWMKKFFSHLTTYEMSAYPLIYSLPLYGIAFIFISVPALDVNFFWYFLVSIPLNGVAYLLYMKAIKISPLSLTAPYLALTPAFMIIPGYIFLNELPDIWGGIGILTTCAGSYILNLDSENRTLFGPVKAIFRETGSMLMFIVSFLFSFCAVIGKMGIIYSSPLFFTLSFSLVFNIFFLIFLLVFRKIHLNTFKKFSVSGVIAGILLFFHSYFHGLAITLTKASYMISVKRLSVLFSMIFGGLVFKEKNLGIRFLGAIFMLTGALIITVMGS